LFTYPNVRAGARIGPRITRGMVVSSQVGRHANRSTRFEARSERRWGNWDVLAVPTALLWSADAYEAALEAEAIDDVMDQEPDDLWP